MENNPRSTVSWGQRNLFSVIFPVPIEGWQNMTHQNMPLWHKDYFELKANENQQMHNKTFQSFPHLTKSRNF